MMPGPYHSEAIRQTCLAIVKRLCQGPECANLAGQESVISRAVAAALLAEEEAEGRRALVKYCHRLQHQGFLAGTSGNLSVRLTGNRILITPSMTNKADLTEDLLVLMDLDGNWLDGGGRASTEAKMHLVCYRERPDVQAVVHCHPPFSVAFAAAKIPLDQRVLPESILILGPVPVVPYGTPSTWDMAEQLIPYLPGQDAFLLAHHGALALGPDLPDAVHRMETLELFAKVILLARMLGGEQLISQAQYDELMRTHGREGYGS